MSKFVNGDRFQWVEGRVLSVRGSVFIEGMTYKYAIQVEVRNEKEEWVFPSTWYDRPLESPSDMVVQYLVTLSDSSNISPVRQSRCIVR